MSRIRFGWSEVSLVPDRPISLAGEFFERVTDEVETPITVTVGTEPNTIRDVEAMGASHVKTQITEVICDKQNKIYTTPCYMLEASIADIADSAENLIEKMLEAM